jgi:hypothetical protein
MEQITLSQEISNCEQQVAENRKDCSALSAGHSNGCSYHHSLSANSTGARLLIAFKGIHRHSHDISSLPSTGLLRRSNVMVMHNRSQLLVLAG